MEKNLTSLHKTNPIKVIFSFSWDLDCFLKTGEPKGHSWCFKQEGYVPCLSELEENALLKKIENKCFHHLPTFFISNLMQTFKTHFTVLETGTMGQ